MPELGDLRVWWIPRVHMKAFYVDVTTLSAARLVLDTLARYDIVQLENNIKPDYSNVGGLLVYDSIEQSWVDWHDRDGRSIDEIAEDEVEFIDSLRYHGYAGA